MPDPLAYRKPWLTPYHYCSNNPLVRVDFFGLSDFIFDQMGYYSEIIENDNPDRLGVKNLETDEIQYYDFNHPNKDVKDIRKLIDVYGNEIPLVYFKTKAEIINIMKDSGVTSEENRVDKMGYAKAESPSGKMDYWGWYLTDEMLGKGISDKYIDNDVGAFYIFESHNAAYNPMDAGNFLWGGGMQQLGFHLQTARMGADYFALKNHGNFDSYWDKRAIKNGFLYMSKMNK